MRMEGRTGGIEEVWYKVKKLVELCDMREDCSFGRWF